MSLVSTIVGTAERVPLPDVIVRTAVQQLSSLTAARLATGSAESDAWLADEMAARALVAQGGGTDLRRAEMPEGLLARMLGPNRKYSCGFYKEAASTLQEAEEEALRQTVEHAEIADGQTILELGSGWGALSLWLARQFPHSNVTALCSSDAQREYIEGEAAKRDLANLRVVSSDPMLFVPEGHFDRILSIEMFEHMLNWRELMTRLRGWLGPDGRFFLQIFSHCSGACLFDRTDSEDWIAQHFFTAGVMPSHHLIRQYADLFEVEKEWRWSGTHYQRTAQDWLENFDRNRDEIEPVLRQVHRDEAALWMRRWRWFLLATAGLSGYADGNEWGVSQYRLKPNGQSMTTDSRTETHTRTRLEA